jgi:glycosyltransferase involved in cell wall biosynthesis
MTEPLVSCIIPAYNYAGWIGAAIDSVLAQPQADDVEIIVIDDGSTDDTASVLAAYGDRVRYVHKENGGLVSSVDRGIAEATGTYLTLLDADDTWPIGRLTPLLEVMETRPEVGLVYGDMDVVDEHGNQIHASFFDTYRVLPAVGRAFPTLIKFNTVSGGAALWRASLKQAYHPIQPAAAYPDWWLGVTIARVAELAYVPVIVNHYRQHGSNMGLAADDGKSMRNLRDHELKFKRWMLATAKDGEIPAMELFQALSQFERLRLVAANHFGVSEPDLHPVTDADAERSRSAQSRAVSALERGDRDGAICALVNSVALDPWNGLARAALETTLTGAPATGPAAVPGRLPGTRGFATLAFAGELVANPELLRGYAEVLGADDDATLVVWAPNWTSDEAMTRLGPVVDDLGLGDDEGPDILVETGASEEALAAGVDAVITGETKGGGFADLPQFGPDSLGELRSLCG